MQYDVNTSSSFNVTVGMGKDNTPVTLHAGDLSKIKENGLKFTMPSPAPLGTLADFIGWVNSKTGSSIPAAVGTGWPTPIADIFNGVLHSVATINTLVIDQPPADKDNDSPPTNVNLTASAVPAADKPISFAIFSVLGAGVGIDRKGVVKA